MASFIMKIFYYCGFYGARDVPHHKSQRINVGVDKAKLFYVGELLCYESIFYGLLLLKKIFLE
jgi:hypothetical protein